MHQISHYQIVGTLGAGGMGEVYLAEDPRLGRKVAIKMLPQMVAQDRDRLRRFKEEARAASALNHPNIITIFDIGEEDGLHYIVSEYIEGETLRQRLSHSVMRISEAIEIGIQAAAALAAAHQAGIIHRDLKPENIMIRPDGYVKVVDFGLAKPQYESMDVSQSQTATRLQTEPGMLLGTLQYFSPEQAKGFEVDCRTDIFSLGVVLHEMIAGRRPFTGDTAAELLAAILHKEPPLLSQAGHPVPVAFQAILLKALRKDPGQRYQSMTELEEDLKSLQVRLQTQETIRSQPRLTQLSVAEGVEESPAWSPDHLNLAFQRDEDGVRKIFIRSLETDQERQLTTGEYDDVQPAWSPDGKILLFVRSQQARLKLEPTDILGMQIDGDIWVHDLETGKENKIISNAFNPSFSPDGKQIALDASWAGPRRIWIVDSHGLKPQQITSDESDETRHIRPRWSPDGTKIVFMNIERTKFDIRVVDVATREITWMTNDLFQDYHPSWSPSGRFIYFTSNRGGGLNIWKMPVSSHGEPDGIPQQLTTGAGQDLYAAVSKNGKSMAFSVLRQNASLWRLPVDAATGHCGGEPEAVITSKREESRGTWSPDGSLIAFNSDRTGDMNIWLYSLANHTARQLTKGPGGDYQPNWSPDGKQLVFFSSRSGNVDLWLIEIESGIMKQLTFGPSLNANPFFSPDGKKIAYMSDQSGRMEVWIMNHDGNGAYQLTNCGTMGHFLRWHPSGSAIYFRSHYSGSPCSLLVGLDGSEPKKIPEIAGGAHMSLSRDGALIMDVVNHKTLWVSPLQGGQPRKVYEFPDPDVRIDYPVWSPDGNWVLFDRFRPRGGDIWLMREFE